MPSAPPFPPFHHLGLIIQLLLHYDSHQAQCRSGSLISIITIRFACMHVDVHIVHGCDTISSPVLEHRDYECDAQTQALHGIGPGVATPQSQARHTYNL